MVQIILLASLAGFASALLSGMLTPGVMALALLFFVAPLPLTIVSFGWHPLAGALAGLFGAIIVDIAADDRMAIAFAALFALPAYVIPTAAARAYGEPGRRIERDGIVMGQLALLLAGYLAFVIIATMIWVEPDYARFAARMKAILGEMLRTVSPPGSPLLADPATFNRVVETMSSILLPASGVFTMMAAVLSAGLGAKIAERSGRLPYFMPTFSAFRLPGGSLILFGATLLVALWDGYTGAFAEVLALGIAILLTLQGLAVLHVRSVGRSGRGLVLAAAWGSILLFGVPALIFLGVGVADHLLDLRNRARAGG